MKPLHFGYRLEPVTFRYPSGWVERIAADRRRRRVACWGSIGWERGALAAQIEVAWNNR